MQEHNFRHFIIASEGKQLDQQKRRLAPLEPGKVTINEFPSNSQPKYAIRRRGSRKLVPSGNE